MRVLLDQVEKDEIDILKKEKPPPVAVKVVMPILVDD